MTVEQRASSAEVFTTRDGTGLRVREHGPADAPITVVFVHGWTLTKHSWDRVVAGLPATAGVPVRGVSFDLRGHGESDPAPAGTATIRQCADDLAELIEDRVPDGPIVLAGHSMGGMTLMALAEQHPQLFADRVRGVALVATSSGGLAAPSLGLPKPIAALFNAGERAVRSKLAAARGRVVSRRSRWMRPGLRWLLFGSKPASSDLATTAEWVAGCHPPSMAGFRESLAEHDRVEALAAFRSVPVMVLAGLDDRLCPYSHARRISEALPHAEHLVYAGAGHMLPLERDDEVTARVADLARAAVR
ncbi:pimeloyl-ACP methyl ester carboxylesterase [Halopolyspora algeriensis]|uniref:Pimeloyl-ACP methyl ester carboxylesterase n=1 Tax=Halopolyspora algeriensis TaxID=1500506 RepID=A0A368VMW6_9ACTN|nr:alpha/beta hydrolase [Halopolyspora algeriensis]RCW42824.1 pimeloyl-ACP methyl ester carboxylesterase [Halopolyspora algeriensis]TQM56706.1 pimeloyl-ACP methyl ester carboxylesterase [Halopolyspora algeriensis]